MAIEDREAALAEARRRFGDRAVVGEGRPGPNWSGGDVRYVGWKECAEWQWLGVGKTWDEAFAGVRKVKTFIKDRIEFYV
jgi:hypothetical protein